MVHLYNKILCSHGKQYFVEECLITPNNGYHILLSEKSLNKLISLKKFKCMHLYMGKF